MALFTTTSISIAGKPIKKYNSLTLIQELTGHHTFSLMVPFEYLEAGMDTLTSSQSFIGKDLLVEIKVKGATMHKYKGVVNSIKYKKTSTTSNHLQIFGTCPAFLLDDHEYCKSFLNKKLNVVVNEVLGNYSVHNKVSPSFKEKIPYTVQYRETAYRYLRRLADEYGQWFYYDGEKLVFGEKEKASAVKLKLGDDLTSYEVKLRSMPLKDISKAYDYLKDETYDSKSQDDKISSVDQFTNELKGASKMAFPNDGNDIWLPKYTEKKQLEKYQEDMKGGIVSNIHEFTGQSRNPAVKLGGSVDIKGTTLKKGGKVSKGQEYAVRKYTLTKIVHIVNNNGEYRNLLTGIPEEYKYPPRNHVSFRHASVQTAVVVKNADKEEEMGRVKVRFPWMESDEETPWIRVSSPHASKDNGYYFVPEVDDQVLVDFEMGCPDLPIILSSLFHGKAKPSKWYHKNNELKAIRTRSGNEILINDRKGKETIKIFNPDEKNVITLTMDESKKIKIESSGYIEIEAAKDLSIKATNVSIHAKNKLSTSSTTFDNSATDIKFKAKSGFNAEAMNTDIKATMAMNVDGMNTKVTAKGMAELSATGNTTVKGMMVMIN